MTSPSLMMPMASSAVAILFFSCYAFSCCFGDLAIRVSETQFEPIIVVQTPDRSLFFLPLRGADT
jgi:hypothetical protein